MQDAELTADYVIVGCGAVGMAFADIILSESDATMIIVDRYAKPGGHWNVAYPFVQLHQPSSYYGVSSKELSGGRLEVGGLNDGLSEVSSGADISAYFDDVMRHQFLPSGRVQYFPMCNYNGDRTFTSKVNGKIYRSKARRKVVDATHLNTSVPSTHTPNFEVGDGVRFMPLNDLPKIEESPDGFVVIGAGKTGIDACLWLLEQCVEPENITWIVSRDSWFLDRRNTQSDEVFFFDSIGSIANEYECIAEATSITDMFDRLEEAGCFVRLDNNVRPSMYHGATISRGELEQLRRLKNVVRLGRVKSISQSEIQLDAGSIPTTSNTVHVDCSASALKSVEIKPIFENDRITLQMVKPYQPVFSAALTAHVELVYRTDEEKNRLCKVVPLPDTDVDYLHFTLAALLNQKEWRGENELHSWIAGNRLNGPAKLIRNIKPQEMEKQAVLDRIRRFMPLAEKRLVELLAETA